MDSKLDPKVKILNCSNNKRRRFKKPWWNNDLSEKWNSVCVAENEYLASKQLSLKSQLRKNFIDKRKDFDRCVQRAKRQYWLQSQQDLININDNNPKEFWKRIGKTGIGNERQRTIPNEIVQDDGTICNNLDMVLDKWKCSFHNLLNPNLNNNCNIEIFV